MEEKSRSTYEMNPAGLESISVVKDRDKKLCERTEKECVEHGNSGQAEYTKLQKI